jgi:hypothetical protein
MTDEPQAKRGDAAWKEQRDAVAQRNAAAQRQAQVDRKTRDGAADELQRENAVRERDQLRALNSRLDQKQGKSS